MRVNVIGCLTLTACLGATDVATDKFGIPTWCLRGILAVESNSNYGSEGGVYIKVGNHARGAAGELGVFQCTPAAFAMVARSGESFSRLALDTVLSERIAARYLLWLRAKYGSWVNAVQSYNTGHPCHAGRLYLNKVMRAGMKP